VLKVFDLEKLVETASKGLDCGAHMRSLTTMEWDLARKCERPVFRQMTARDRAGLKVWQHTKRSGELRRDIEFQTRCRQCPPCLAIRAAFWRLRAAHETKSAPRSWFMTLTLTPAAHFEMLVRASVRLRARGEDFDDLPADRQFAERHAECGKELTLWLKRVRKQSGAALRYCLVAEAHKSGLPHYHALIHEVDRDRPVRASVLRGQWKLGFSQAKLVAQGDEGRSAAYVAKYLSKSASARVRASQGYGHIADQSSFQETTSRHSFLEFIKMEKQRETLPDTPSDAHDEKSSTGAVAPMCRTTEGVSAAMGANNG
jgi:hypothetical protein